MAPSPDHEDTQVLDSPPPEEDATSFDETQPVEDFYTLYGETQIVEEEEDVVRGVEEWIETQAIDVLEETQVLDNGDAEGENLFDGGEEETQVLVDDGAILENKGEDLAGPCASADDGSNGGGQEIGKELEIDDSHEHMQAYDRDAKNCRMHNSRVRKLLYKKTSSLEDETANNPNDVGGKADSPCSLAPDYVAAGLSYIDSQEPGDMTQTNALDVVDKLISVSDLGLSQETNTEKMDVVKSHPISSVKGSRSLAKMVDHRSPVGKKRTFEWIDSQEDDGGGEFFTKRKDSFFESKVVEQKLRSQPPKSKQVSFGLAKEGVQKSGKKLCNIQNQQKAFSLTCSDSKLMLHSSFRSKKANASITKTKKKLFKDQNEQSNPLDIEQQLEVTDIGKDGDGTYEVGPDTQMAAEAMEALVHGSPIDIEKNDAHALPENSAKNGSEDATMKRSSRTRSSTPNTEGVSTRSKRTGIVPTDSRIRISKFSRSKPQKGNNTDCTAVKVEGKVEKKKPKGHLNKRNFANKIESSVSLNIGIATSSFNGAINKEIDNQDNPLTLNLELTVSKEHTSCEFHVSSTPVAHRTRHSKADKLSKENGALANSRRDTGESTGVRTRSAITREDKLSVNASGTLKKKRKTLDIASNQDAIGERIESRQVKSGLLVEDHPKRDIASNQDAIGERIESRQAKSGLLVEDHPKRRRTSKVTSDNPCINYDMDKSSVSVDNIRLSTRNRDIKATTRSVSEILDTARRKKRSVSTRLASEFNGMPSSRWKLTLESTVARSSMKFLSKPNVEDCSNKCLTKSVSHKGGSTDAADPCSTPLKQGGDALSLNENEGEKVNKLKGSSTEDLQPSAPTCTTPLKDSDVVSPVFVVQDHPRASDSKSRCRSLIARELMRLEACQTSPTTIFNMRRRRDIARVRILFSHHLDDDIIKHQKKIMGRLGVALASSISDATHFVTDKFMRTRNMLEAMAMGKPVVTHLWLESCGQTSCFIDEKNYILRDAKKEKEIGFSMPVSLAHACRSPLLQGKRVYITPNTKPGLELLTSLVKASHGQAVERLGRSALKDDKLPEDLLVLSCEEDYALCIPLLEKGAEIFSSELLLNGIVIQKLEYERHGLFSDHVRRTRSTIWLRQKDGKQFLPVTKCT